MGKIITVINQKGGVGKSTTAMQLLAGLTLRGYKALAVDLDNQGSLSSTARASRNGLTIMAVLTGEAKAAEAVQETKAGDIIASNKALVGADATITDVGKEYRLKEALKPLLSKYDYIILDTPPALGILTVNALTACNECIIPAKADIYSLSGIEELYSTIKTVKKYCNPGLKIKGILLTMYDQRTILNRELAELTGRLAEKIGTKVFKTTVRQTIDIGESQMKREDIFSYDKEAPIAKDYNNFIDEVLKDEEEER